MNFVQPIRDLKKLDKMARILRGQSERNWMLLFAGVNTGLRISDLLTLRVKDVQGHSILLIEKKTKKRDWKPLTAIARRGFKKYTRGMDDRVYLFRSRQGTNKPLSRSGAYKLLRKAADAAGLHHIGTHTLRKTFGYHLYKKKKDVALLQAIFNHAHPATTLRYIGIDQDVIAKKVEGFGLLEE